MAVLAALVLAPPALAQRCNTHYELIVDMVEPEIGSYNVWDAVYGGLDWKERLVSTVVKDDGHVVTAGEKFFYEDGAIDVILAEMDRRGRVLWEIVHTEPGLIRVMKILPHKDGYVVFAEKEEKERGMVWMGFFGPQGKLLREKTLVNREGHLKGHDVIAMRDGEGYLLSTSLDVDGYGSGRHAILYRIDNKGGPVWDRAYMPGLENRILGIDHTGGSDYMATGYIYAEDGRRTGWVMRLDAKGGILWQRQYPRGRASQLRVSQDFLEDFVVVAGDADPAGGGNRAGWLMTIASVNGDIAWQRYYRGDFHYYGREVLTNSDGMISFLLDARFPEQEKGDKSEKKNDYARLLTINPRGVLFISDEYYNAKGARALQMLYGQNKERIMVGETDNVYRIEGQEDAEDIELKRSLDGWVVAATSVEPYDDPCRRSYSFLP